MIERPSDQALLATAITALLIREGGKVIFTPDEWQAAIAHPSSIYIHRFEEHTPVMVVLLDKEGAQA